MGYVLRPNRFLIFKKLKFNTLFIIITPINILIIDDREEKFIGIA